MTNGNIFNIIQKGIEMGASDIHLTLNQYPTFRVNGVIQYINKGFSILDRAALDLFVKDLIGDKYENYKKQKSYDGSMTYKNSRLRIHIFKQSGASALVLRIIPKDVPELSDLRLPMSIKKCIDLKEGLVLVTGVTGSGKSSTLAAIINEINKTQRKHIVTIEDPIEFIHKHKSSLINQREVGSDVDSFSNATKDAMREDPDILMLGEMRDLDTIKNAMTLAETGHLVFGTLHTRSVAETTSRIIDIFPANQQEQIRTQYANTIQAIISQELIPGKNGGRVPVCEIMYLNNATRNIIKSNGNISSIIDTLRSEKNGSLTRIQSLAQLLKSNLITEETAFKGLNDEEKRELMKLF